MSETNPCQGCGADCGIDNPPSPTHCGQCPPWRCDDCGEMDSSANPCPCWIDLTDMPLADVKALFAARAPELSIDPVIDRG